MNNPKRQVGGDHYTGMKYQPVAFASKMRYNFIQGSILKYVSRFPRKNGKEDLMKAMHFCELGVETNPTNFALPTLEETKRYVKQNALPEELVDLIEGVSCQFWMGVSTAILSLCEKYYGTKD